MKEIRLKTLNLKNFKGIHNFVLDTQGKNTCIFGENATGKSSLFDSFLWILFGKNSQWQNQFEIKPLNADGEPIHGVESSVEIVLDVNGETSVLKKIYREVWQKKRGSATAEFTGHTTDHFVDGVPVKKSEYDAKIAEIADEQIFRLLTDPRYFNEVLHWQKRRELLLEVCGDVSDAEVIASKKDLAKLGDILGNRTIEQHRKVIQARRTEINKELEKIPVRIDEVKRGLPNIDDITNPDELPNDIAKLREELKSKQEELAQAKAGGQVAEKTKELRLIEGQILDLRNKHRQAVDKKLAGKSDERVKLQNEINRLKVDIDAKNRTIQYNESEIKSLEEKMEKLRADWREANAQQFEFEQDDVCPTCGQALPEEQIQATRDKALGHFNILKVNKLENINAEGKRLKDMKTSLEENLAYVRRELEKAKAELVELEQKEDALKEDIDAIMRGAEPVESTPEYYQLYAKQRDLQDEIRKLEADSSLAVAKIQKEIVHINTDIFALEQAAARLEARKNGVKRIEDLKAEERRLASEFEELEQQIYLTEEFIRTKVELLEGKINSKFRMARFKLFNTLVNGGIDPCCETVYDGVPYSNLNNGARLNIGLDIINTLAEHYGFAPVVFIDNAESVVNILPTKGQQIRLIVSGMDKKLRIELAEKKEMKEVV
jgi:DNA repair exonuclease SbcCD ATPase subunit